MHNAQESNCGYDESGGEAVQQNSETSVAEIR